MRKQILPTSVLVVALSDHKIGTPVRKIGVFPDASARSSSYGADTAETERRRDRRMTANRGDVK